ncbi:c-type cytochrome biogenesis protein CcmI [Solemya velum gill symbiont]|uniref:C-type cytochrome biogenesis protein CcmI n=1 Tax=Solemya velum gill symbiont TaxID=2340 RepID=A0A1T2DY02_SOVGS|nr:c-type cytochrome biogenesis protein CcmI [Solemya velum gill symbiont]OOY35735.1 c-type cytochrome biogenesis protein CcmI [Solemya velum gill symbiont]OOY38363.1 c-type cytochrome biogenesis protein CcmI [Solemya velum gill symbiont]OOY40961.1 c-type cytochrome biogenesis protein CcmI [Solemya velum gill symbiont]OOY45201.1 c-type cytochrome biogenesis protein CcmI [Solemya velum gill symbiont]OOY46819.1 c-type cytochrome biogenesis protein CcmI [Solemya velum gill symbiont]
MTLFWIVTAVMLVIAMVMVAPALLRPVIRNTSTGDSENTEIARERLEQIRQSHTHGELSDSEFAQGVSEVEAILAEELATQERSELTGNPFGKVALIAIVLSLPVFTFFLYQFVGTPEGIDAEKSAAQQQQTPAGHQTSQEGEMPSMPDLVDQLAIKLQQEPENADGWFMLGRSQMTLGRYEDAVASFRQVDGLVPSTSPVLLALANAVAMAQGGQIAGEPEELVLRALEIEPNDSIGLWLAGNARHEAGDFQGAIDYWQRAIPLLADSPADQQELTTRMQTVASQAGISLNDTPQALAPVSKTLTVKVSLDAALADQLTGTETLFVFARAVSGSPMPLAASRHSVNELPVEVELTDAMAMMPAMKLSGFDEVKVSAKISSSGSATPGETDLVSEAVVANPGQGEAVSLVVNKQRQ